MQVLHAFHDSSSSLVGYGVRVLLCSDEGEDGPLARKLSGLGAHLDRIDELFTAMAEVIDDPMGYAVMVIDCDTGTVGGLEGGLRAVNMMGEAAWRLPVILISRECQVQTFPEDRHTPTQLRAPLSAVSLRVGMEHVLRDRLVYRAA